MLCSTKRVLDYLIQSNDMVPFSVLKEHLSIDSSRLSAALTHLYRVYAVDVVEQNKVLWWFATPESDRRRRTITHVKEHTLSKIRKGRKSSNRKPFELPTR